MAIEQFLWKYPNEMLSNERIIFRDNTRGNPYNKITIIPPKFQNLDKLNINPEIIGNMTKNIYEKKKIKNILKLKVF